jgi:hypothetical protein
MRDSSSERTQTKSCSGRKPEHVPMAAGQMPTSSPAMPGSLGRAKKWRRKKELKRTLLANGGKEVVWPVGEVSYLHDLVAGGCLFYERVRLRRGDPDQAQCNDAQFWGQCFDRFHLVTGFALGADGRWMPHGWVVGWEGRKGTNYLYETTHRRERYYGYILTHAEAVHFWIRDFLWGCGEGPLAALCGIGNLEELYRVLGPGRSSGSGRAGPAGGV